MTKRKQNLFSLPVVLPPNLSRQLIPLQALVSFDGMSKWKKWQLVTGAASSPSLPCQVPARGCPSARLSVCPEQQEPKPPLGGKTSTPHFSFPSPPESCRWEICAESGEFSSFEARVTVFSFLFYFFFTCSSYGFSRFTAWFEL